VSNIRRHYWLIRFWPMIGFAGIWKQTLLPFYSRFSFASSGSDSNTNSFKASNSGSSLAPKSERSIAINIPRDSALRENGSGVKAVWIEWPYKPWLSKEEIHMPDSVEMVFESLECINSEEGWDNRKVGAILDVRFQEICDNTTCVVVSYSWCWGWSNSHRSLPLK